MPGPPTRPPGLTQGISGPPGFATGGIHGGLPPPPPIGPPGFDDPPEAGCSTHGGGMNSLVPDTIPATRRIAASTSGAPASIPPARPWVIISPWSCITPDGECIRSALRIARTRTSAMCRICLSIAFSCAFSPATSPLADATPAAYMLAVTDDAACLE